jgi:N-sulfoglucosamine sulfohydrolase
MASRPNILYIHSHDSGRFIQPYGHAISTPNMQRLAEEGTLFRRAFCCAPSCSASRSALLTGQSPHSNGMNGLTHRGFALHDYSHHILHTLRDVGYTSTLCGVQHITADIPKIGYDNVLSQPKGTGTAAAEFLHNAPSEPFFLSVGFFDTHRPYPEPGSDEDERYTLPPPPFPDTPETRHEMACYKASARRYDVGVGQVLDALDEAGLAENTLVINTTDHGLEFPNMKCTLFDHGIGVMLTMRGPGGFNGGKVCDSLVSQVDIFPTICDLLEIGLPERLEGTSLMPVIRGEVNEVNDEVFAEVTYHASYEPQRTVRTDRWKYIRRYGDKTTPALPNCGDSVSKTMWMDNGWASQTVDAEQLYDLMFDPAEMNNVADDPALCEVLCDMRRRLDGWMKRTNDELQSGYFVAPTGSKINYADDVSPQDEPYTVE